MILFIVKFTEIDCSRNSGSDALGHQVTQLRLVSFDVSSMSEAAVAAY